MVKQKFIQENSKPVDILQGVVGNFGKWQFCISLFMALLKFPIAWFQFGIVFLAPPTNFWCKAPDKYKNVSMAEWIEISQQDGLHNQTKDYLPGRSCFMVDILHDTKSVVPCQYGYEYNRSIFHSSIITEWNLVCGKERMIDISQITLMLGVLIGSILFGVTADRIGRKKTLMICIFFQSICGVISALSPSLWMFILSRFLLAIANGGTVITSFVMCMEVVGGIWRAIVPVLYQVPFGIGNSIMAGLAYLFRDWRDLQLVLSALSSVFILYLWIVPESPRWLMAVGKEKEAVRILERAATMNGLDPRTVQSCVAQHYSSESKEKPKISAVFSTKALRTRTTLLCLNWLICGISFFAFTQYLGQVGSNIFFTVSMGGIIVLPGTLLCIYVIGKCGRKWAIISAHLVTAICYLVILAIPLGRFPQDWPRIGAAGLGVVGMSVSMPGLYLFTGELYPTVVRNAGVGMSVMFSRIGSMLAPLVISLHKIAPWVPLVILATLAIAEALLVLPLPETKGTLLPDNIEDICDKRPLQPSSRTSYELVDTSKTIKEEAG